MIKVFHVSEIVNGYDLAAVQAAWTQGLYTKVATIDTDDRSVAWQLTNNIDSSWSQDPDPLVTVNGQGYTEYLGRRWGIRSSTVGDVFMVGDVPYAVAMVGYRELEMPGHHLPEEHPLASEV